MLATEKVRRSSTPQPAESCREQDLECPHQLTLFTRRPYVVQPRCSTKRKPVQALLTGATSLPS